MRAAQGVLFLQGGLLCDYDRPIFAADLFRADFPRRRLGVLVDPVVGARGRLVSMPAHIDLELTTRATPLPIGYAIACAIEPGTAAQIEIADEHAAEMGDVADVVAGARAERQEEFDGARADDIDLHGDGYGEGNEPDFAVWEHNGRGQQDSINRAGSANSRCKGGANPRRVPGPRQTSREKACSAGCARGRRAGICRSPAAKGAA